MPWTLWTCGEQRELCTIQGLPLEFQLLRVRKSADDGVVHTKEEPKLRFAGG